MGKKRNTQPSDDAELPARANGKAKGGAGGGSVTLTRDAILQKTAPRFEWIEIEGWGKVGIRSVSRVRQSLRESSMRDQATGEMIPEEAAKIDAYSMVDQLMISESESMFTESDVEMLAMADTAALMPLLLAINEFNVKGASPGK